jgi:hypothetical protein
MQKQVQIGWKELCAGLSLAKTVLPLIRVQMLSLAERLSMILAFTVAEEKQLALTVSKK